MEGIKVLVGTLLFVGATIRDAEGRLCKWEHVVTNMESVLIASLPFGSLRYPLTFRKDCK